MGAFDVVRSMLAQRRRTHSRQDIRLPCDTFGPCAPGSRRILPLGRRGVRLSTALAGRAVQPTGRRIACTAGSCSDCWQLGDPVLLARPGRGPGAPAPAGGHPRSDLSRQASSICPVTAGHHPQPGAGCVQRVLLASLLRLLGNFTVLDLLSAMRSGQLLTTRPRRALHTCALRRSADGSTRRPSTRHGRDWAACRAAGCVPRHRHRHDDLGTE